MAMTDVVKDELSRLEVEKLCCRRAEVSVLLRLAGGLDLSAGRVVIEAELDTSAAARRLQASIAEAFGQPAEFATLAGVGSRAASRYLVRVSKGQAGESVARQAGMIDQRGCPVRGLPPQVVSGGTCDCEAAWRAAFLASGSLTEPGRSMALEVTCPGFEAALALVGAARRMKVPARARDARGVDRVVIRDGDAIAAMLTRLRAHRALLEWEERRAHRAPMVGPLVSPADSRRMGNLDAANLCRSVRAASAAADRAERALQILGDDAGYLSAAAKLRIAHRHATLEALGQLADPPLTKDAIAGRIRRLLAMADRRAAERGMPGTEEPEEAVPATPPDPASEPRRCCGSPAAGPVGNLQMPRLPLESGSVTGAPLTPGPDPATPGPGGGECAACGYREDARGHLIQCLGE